MTDDKINSPSHYTSGNYETWDFIRDMGLSYEEGNVVKYLSRAGKKTKDPSEDLAKAAAYLRRIVARGTSKENMLRFVRAKQLDPVIAGALVFMLTQQPDIALRLLEAKTQGEASAEGSGNPKPEPRTLIKG